MKNKKCSQCGIDYPSSVKYFNKQKTGRDGLRSVCKKCRRGYCQDNKKEIKEYHEQYYREHKVEKQQYDRSYREQNKDRISDYHKQYAEDNIEKIEKYRKLYYKKNKDAIFAKNKEYYIQHDGFKEYKKEYYFKNKKQIAEKNKEYCKKHKQEIKEKKKEYRKKHKKEKNERERSRRASDVSCRVLQNLRNRLNKAVKSQNTAKNERTLKLVGCSVVFLKQYMESKFTEGMTWDNYGKGGWHIDHVKPCVSFDLTDPEQQKECFYYSNLQPLWSEDNLKKNSFYNGELIRRDHNHG